MRRCCTMKCLLAKTSLYPSLFTFLTQYNHKLRTERSSDQVVKPVNLGDSQPHFNNFATLDALSKWVGKIPEDVVSQMAEVAPMLRVLGYDPVSSQTFSINFLNIEECKSTKLWRSR